MLHSGAPQFDAMQQILLWTCLVLDGGLLWRKISSYGENDSNRYNLGQLIFRPIFHEVSFELLVLFDESLLPEFHVIRFIHYLRQPAKPHAILFSDTYKSC